MCGFPTCGNEIPPERRERPGQFKISLSKNKIYDVSEARDYCSENCLIESKLFASQLTAPLYLPEEVTPAKPLIEDVTGTTLRPPVESSARPHPDSFAKPRGDAFSLDGHTPHQSKPEVSEPRPEPAPAALWNGELPVRRWWEEPALPGRQKWRTLRHNGPVFPPPYEAYGAPLYYEGRAVALLPHQEEIASFYAAQLNSHHITNPTFRQNFLRQFKEILYKTAEGRQVADLTKLDFTKLQEALEMRKEEKKAARDSLKAEKARLQEIYGVCLVDGHPARVAAFKIEPPGLFLGRGSHPKAGLIKRRIQAEDITLNIGAQEPVPSPPPGHRWGSVLHDTSIAWLFSWQDTITGTQRYCFPHIDPQRSTFQIFEKAREAGSIMPELRRSYRQAMTQQSRQQRQLGTAAYLIDHLGLRTGNEEAEAVGCCTLRVQHVRLGPDCQATLDFLGKDSLRYFYEGKIDPVAWENLRDLQTGQGPADLLFTSVTASQLNSYLVSFKPGLTAKIVRTYNFSSALEQELEQGIDSNDPVAFYKTALRTVQTQLNVPVINYADPRILVAWAKRTGVDLSRLLSAAHRERYSWALDTPASWRFAPRPRVDVSEDMDVAMDGSYSDSSDGSEDSGEEGDFQSWIFRQNSQRPALSPFAQLVLVIQTWWTEDTTGWLRGTFGNTEHFRKLFSAPHSPGHPLVKRKAELERLLATVAANIVLDAEFFQLVATLDEAEIPLLEELSPRHWDVLYLTVLQALSAKLRLSLDEGQKQAVLRAAGISPEQYQVLLDVASAPH